MPKLKLKTHKGTAKRVRRTVTGKLLRLRSGSRHMLAKKSENRKRVIRTDAVITGSVAKKIKRALGV